MKNLRHDFPPKKRPVRPTVCGRANKGLTRCRLNCYNPPLEGFDHFRKATAPNEMKYWLAVGTPQNWKSAFDLGNTWGLKNKGPQATNWKQVQIGDILIFYAVSPVKGIIGYGVVQQKLKQDTPLWPEESAKKEVIWPLRLIFEVRSCLSPDRWLEDKVINDRVSFRAKMGFREILENLAAEVLAPFQTLAVSAEAEQSLHGRIVDSLLEIGRLQNYLRQKEYPMGKARLDAV